MKYAGAVRRNVRVLYIKMCGCGAAKCGGYGAPKCAYGASNCAGIMRSAGMMRRSAAMVRRRAEMVRRNSDHERRQIHKIELYLRTVLIFIKETVFQSVALNCTIKTGTKCKSWLKSCDSHKTRFLLLQKGSMVSVIFASTSPSNSRFLNNKKMFDAQWRNSMANINLCKSRITYFCDSTHSFRDINVSNLWSWKFRSRSRSIKFTLTH